MKYTVTKNAIYVIGTIWLPPIVCAQKKELTTYDMENIKDENGKITRDSVERWLSCHSGDFSQVIDFSADFDYEGKHIDIPWSKGEESELTYSDCMFSETE
jgi:hypothetical protein